MSSDEARIGEAVASLTARLSQAGAPEPHALATELIHELIQDGWRPRAPGVIRGPALTGQTAPPEVAHHYAEQARAALRNHQEEAND